MATRSEWLTQQTNTLLEKEKWDDLILLRLGCRWFPALSNAIEVLERRANAASRWAPAARFVAEMKDHPYQAVEEYWEGLPESILNPCSTREADCLNLLRHYGFSALIDLANQFPDQRQQMLEDGVASAKRAARLSQRLGARSCEAHFLGLQACGESYLNENPRAVRTFSKAILLLRQQSQPTQAFHANVLAPLLNNLGDSHFEMREYSKALELYQESDQTYRLFSSEAEPFEVHHHGQVLNNCALTLYRMGRNQEALEYTNQSASKYDNISPPLLEERLLPVHHSQATLQSNTGMILEALGRPEEAIDQYDQALELLRRDIEQSAPDMAMVLSNRSNAAQNLGHLEAALEGYEAAIRIYSRLAEMIPSRFVPQLVATQINQSLTQASFGSLEKAEASCREALVKLVQFGDREFQFEKGMAYLARAILRESFGQAELALDDSLLAQEIFQEIDQGTGGTAILQYAATVNNSANLLGDLGRWEEALPLYQRNVLLRKELYRKNRSAHRAAYSSALNGLATALSAHGRRDQAVRRFRQALFHRRILHEETPRAYRHLLAGTLTNLGCELLKLDRSDEAIECLEESLQLHRLVEDRVERSQLVSALAATAACYRNQARQADPNALKHALALLDEAISVDQEVRRMVFDPYLRRGITSRHHQLFDVLLAVRLDQAELKDDRPDLQKSALLAAETGRARLVKDFRQTRCLKDTPRKLHAERRRLLRQLGPTTTSPFGTTRLPAAEFRAFAGSFSSAENLPPPQTSRDVLLQRLENCEAELEHYKDYSVKKTDWDLTNLQNHIPNHGVVVHISLLDRELGGSRQGDSGSVAFILNQNKCISMRLPELFLENLVEAAAPWIEGRAASSKSRQKSLEWSEKLTKLLKMVSEYLARPVANKIEKHFPDTETVIVVAHRVLHLLPIAACHAEYRGRDNLLGEHFEICTIPSLSLLPDLMRPSNVGGQPVVIRPETDGIGALPYANPEIEGLKKTLTGDIFENRDNTSKHFILDQLAGRPIIHFSGHAVYDGINTYQSRLLLAGSAAIPRHGLTMEEIVSLDSIDQCRLVTLNCCEGSFAIPTEGDDLVPLNVAFLIAGAKCVIGNLWHVDDAAAALLVTELYRHLLSPEHPSPSAALARAQAWLRDLPDGSAASKALNLDLSESGCLLSRNLRKRGKRPFADPFYWAGYTVSGAGWLPIRF